MKCLPNPWLRPFGLGPLGLDKLWKVQAAEKSKRYPLLMLGDHDRYGDTYAQWGSLFYVVLTRDPRNLRAILSKNFKGRFGPYFSTERFTSVLMPIPDYDIGIVRRGCVAPLLGDSIFTQDGPRWEQSRRQLAPLLQRSNVLDLEIVEKHFERLLSRISLSPNASGDEASSGNVNLKDALFDLSLNIAIEFLLGDPTNVSFEEKAGESLHWSKPFADELNTAFHWVSKRERLKFFYWIVDGREFRRSCRICRDMTEYAIRKLLDNLKNEDIGKGSNAALAPLLRDSIDVEAIRDTFLTLLLAGRDTTGSLLCWIFYALSREPDIFTLLKSETEELLGPGRTRKPTRSDLGRMKNLDFFISESMSCVYVQIKASY